MSKVTIAISVDEDTIELFSELKVRYHLKNNSAVIRMVVRQWQMFLDERQKIRESMIKKQEKEKKPSNPMVDL
jgi:hypothetical protein